MSLRCKIKLDKEFQSSGCRAKRLFALVRLKKAAEGLFISLHPQVLCALGGELLRLTLANGLTIPQISGKFI